jgi:hypothetical protein
MRLPGMPLAFEFMHIPDQPLPYKPTAPAAFLLARRRFTSNGGSRTTR